MYKTIVVYNEKKELMSGNMENGRKISNVKEGKGENRN
jgi:hypothetical protein